MVDQLQEICVLSQNTVPIDLDISCNQISIQPTNPPSKLDCGRFQNKSPASCSLSKYSMIYQMLIKHVTKHNKQIYMKICVNLFHCVFKTSKNQKRDWAECGQLDTSFVMFTKFHATKTIKQTNKHTYT